jgi:FMN reductase
MTLATSPRVLGLGGSTRAGSRSESALRVALDYARELGAEIDLVVGPDLILPLYEYGNVEGDKAKALIEKLAWADAIIVGSPGYHGSTSGMVKNALDYAEELRGNERPYFDGMPVGCIAVADGWQAAVTTLQSLRSIVHALRGWPTPLGAAINNSGYDGPVFSPTGECAQEAVRSQLQAIGGQVMSFVSAVRR